MFDASSNELGLEARKIPARGEKGLLVKFVMLLYQSSTARLYINKH